MRPRTKEDRLGRKKEVTPEAESRGPERGGQAQAGGQGEGRAPEKQAQTSPGRAEKRPRRPSLPRRESGRRHARPAGRSGSYHLRVSLWAFRRDLHRAAAGHTHAEGPEVEFPRERNLPPTPHATRLTVSRDLSRGQPKALACPPEGSECRCTSLPAPQTRVFLPV